MGPLERLRIWDDPAIRDALAWYLDVAENRRPAKFRAAMGRISIIFGYSRSRSII